MAEGVKTGGRKKGVPNKKTAELQAQVAAAGATPLDVMLENMRMFHDKARAHLKAMLDAGTEKPEGFDALAAMQRCYDMAQTAAKDAAPYIHPKLANIELGNKPGEKFVVQLLPSDDD